MVISVDVVSCPGFGFFFIAAPTEMSEAAARRQRAALDTHLFAAELLSGCRVAFLNSEFEADHG